MEALKQNLLQFNPHYIVEIVSPDEIFLLSEDEKKILRGPLFFSIAAALKSGPLSEDALVEMLKEQASAAEIYYALYQLRDRGYLEEAVEDESLAAFCHYLDVSYPKAKKALSEICYQVESLSQEPVDFEKSLSALGIQKDSSGKLAKIKLLVIDDYLDERIETIVDSCLEEGTACLLLKPAGKTSWIGPLFTPENNACFSCLKFWMNWNHLEENYIKEKREEREKIFFPKATLLPTLHLAVSSSSLELFKWIVGSKETFLEKGIVTFDMVKNLQEKHHLNRWSMCPACKHEDGELSARLDLISRKKGTENDGGHHSVAPSETIKRYGSLISPITGIIPGLEKSSVAENLHAYSSSYHNFSMNGKLGKLGIEHYRQLSAGKGKTEIQAKASALGEGIERHSGIFQGNERRVLASYEQIKNEAINPRNCSLFSDRQYKNREQTNADPQSFHRIPAPFNEKEEIEWSPLWSLTEGRWKYLPTSYCYYENGLSQGEMHEKVCFADSNGCAAGNTLEEAILQGFFELVERDCSAIWWYNQIPMAEVDLASLSDPFITKVIKEYADLGRDLWVLDLTNDLEIPTFVACSANENGGEIFFGLGTNFDPQIALFRAVTEMNQMILLQKAVKKTVEYEKGILDGFSKWIQTATVENQPYFSPNGKKKKLQDYVNRETSDLKADILLCQKIVEDKGMEMVVLDQTRPEIGMPVVRVVVPGLRHFWPRCAPGRLYDIPVKMGWLDKANTEETLNSIPIMI